MANRLTVMIVLKTVGGGMYIYTNFLVGPTKKREKAYKRKEKSPQPIFDDCAPTCFIRRSLVTCDGRGSMAVCKT